MPEVLPGVLRRRLRLPGMSLPAWLALVAAAIPLLLAAGAAALLLRWMAVETVAFPIAWPAPRPALLAPVPLAVGGALALLTAALLTAVMLRGLARQHAAASRRLAGTRRLTEERRLSDVAAHLPGAIYRRVLYPDGRVRYPYFSPGLDLDLPEAPAPESLDDVAARLFHPDDRGHWRAAVEASARNLTPFLCELRLAADGRWVRSAARPRVAGDGAVVWDGVLLDISDLKGTEAALKRSLAERDGMLREIHHRVRNNLQVVSSLIQIEAFQITDAAARDRLAEVSRRIGALGHLHEQLYRSSDFASIDCAEHILLLCRNLLQSHSQRAIVLRPALRPVRCNLDTAIPLGLMTHELLHEMIGALLRRADGGTVQVRLERDGAEVVLAIDTGAAADAPALGHRLLHALAAQVEARLVATATGAAIRIAGHRFSD